MAGIFCDLLEQCPRVGNEKGLLCLADLDVDLTP